MTAYDCQMRHLNLSVVDDRKYNNKKNGITQRRFLLHANPLLADWVTDHVGDEWITDRLRNDRLRLPDAPS